MKPTIPYLLERFEHFNTVVFGGRLPVPVVSLCDVTSFVGQYKSRLRSLPDGRHEHYDHQLRFSTAFNLDENELEDTIIHEMIHYFISYNELSDRTAHGPLFKALMNSINETHGRNITISHRTSSSRLNEAKEAKKKWHVIAILHFGDGQLGVKVLPRVIPRIIDYYKIISSAPNISKVDLYLHNDPFFNRFPTSTGRRCHAISPADARDHVAGAHTLTVSGNRLVQH